MLLRLHGSCYKTSSCTAFRWLESREPWITKCSLKELPSLAAFRRSQPKPTRKRSAEDRTPQAHCCKTLSNKTFHVILTVFSNLFSSFLHSTSSLSVSQAYLVLGESHLPLRFAFPNKSTLLRGRTIGAYGADTLYGAGFIQTFKRDLPTASTIPLGFTFGLLDVQSPLLIQSRLLSFPGLR